MKTLSMLVAAAICAGSLVQAESESHEIWWKLSVRCQNVAKVFTRLSPTGAVDPSFFEDDLKAIDKALAELVRRGELVEKEFTFPALDTASKKRLDVIGKFIENLSAEYGYFVARELVDMGLKRRLSAPNLPMRLKVRLPVAEMKRWNDLVHGETVAPQGQAEQDGSRQPATRPESKSE